MSLLVVQFPAPVRFFRIPLWFCPAFGMAVITLGFSGPKPWLGYQLSTDLADLATAVTGLGLAIGSAWLDAMVDPGVPKQEGDPTRAPMIRRMALYLLSQAILAPLVALLMIILARWAA
jgi:hypothetical protein